MSRKQKDNSEGCLAIFCAAASLFWGVVVGIGKHSWGWGIGVTIGCAILFALGWGLGLIMEGSSDDMNDLINRRNDNDSHL